jgi:NAD(P)-dependent dehydrogenase (short-subunit alcohol dehydrogenase family)
MENPSLVIEKVIRLSTAGDVGRLVDRVEADLAPIEILVNNAGVVVRKTFLQTTEADFDWQFATNVKGLFLMSHAVATRMAARRGGNIVNIIVSSMDQVVAEADRANYVTSRRAATMLTRGMPLGPVPWDHLTPSLLIVSHQRRHPR